MINTRNEKDFLGILQIKDDAYYGIHSMRAHNNFKITNYHISNELIKSFSFVKEACAKTNKDIGLLEKDKADAIITACHEMRNGKFDKDVIVDPLQGGAGTSTNMNINEIIANRALEILGYKKGEYHIISPLDHVNLNQSTNDVYPTSVKLSILFMLNELEKNIEILQSSLQKKENEFSGIIKLGRTQLMDAVPITLGMEFSAYAEALARDRWRIFKSRERIKVINLGGTAVGTGIGAPRDYILKVCLTLKKLTGLNISRSENLIDATQNLDSIVEVSGMLRCLASNLFKISNDLRLLGSGPNGGLSEIVLPALQAGSTVMPGKINPVIPEAIAQSSLRVMSNDSLITLSCSSGNLEINQYYPLIAFSIIESLQILINSTKIFSDLCISGIQANNEKCRKHLNNSQAIATLFMHKVGYGKMSELSIEAKNKNKSLIEHLIDTGILTDEDISKALSSQNINSLGYRSSNKK